MSYIITYYTYVDETTSLLAHLLSEEFMQFGEL